MVADQLAKTGRFDAQLFSDSGENEPFEMLAQRFEKKIARRDSDRAEQRDL